MFEYQRKIYGFECDIYGHLNNANYLHLLEEARSEALEQAGFSLKELNERGVHIYLKKIEIDYLLGVNFGEVITIKTSTMELSKIKFVWLQEIYNRAGKLTTKAIVTGIFSKDNRIYRLSEDELKAMQISMQ
ncbi:MAG: acyl-CoA thioesterase [Candidatus Cloacimonadia bacterium]